MPKLPEDGRCFYCGKPMVPPVHDKKHVIVHETRTIDHVMPKSRGGKNTARNKVYCCHGCNVDKGSLNLQEYRVVVMYRLGMIKMSGVFSFHGEV